jgi:tellurium resistance protein TerD
MRNALSRQSFETPRILRTNRCYCTIQGENTMGVSLTKGGNVNLSKAAPGLTEVIIGLGWDPRVTDGAAFDADASAFLLKADGKVSGDADFIFYNQKTSSCGAVVHQGDNTTGQGDGDDEKVEVNLTKVAPTVEKISFGVTIHDADTRRQNFGMISKAFIRVVNKTTGEELAKFDLSEDASTETAMVFGELYRAGTEWKFKAIGQGYAGGLAALAGGFGVSVG